MPEKMKKSARSAFPATLSSKTLPRSPDSDLHERLNERKPHRRKTRSTSFSSAGIRLKRDGVSAGKRSGPATPLLRWKFDDGDFSVSCSTKQLECSRKGRRKPRNGVDVSISARKLASGLWQLQYRSNDRPVVEPVGGHVRVPYLCHPNSTEYATEMKDQLPSPLLVPRPKNGILNKLEPSITFPNPAMERATKWDPGCSKTSDEVYRYQSQLNLLEDRQLTTISVVSALKTELEQARHRIHELETERRSSKKKLDHFLRKLAEERSSWRSREHEKIRAIIDDVKNELNRERKNRQRLEIVNSKLMTELTEAKISAKRFLQDYDKERKARELMEEVCDELAKEIGEDKAEVEALKRESMKIREEVEEEKKMLQMAEVWREERVQMKLVDAKLTLEDKYSQLSKLQTDLEAFLKSRSKTADAVETREAELLKEAASSVKIQDIKEFSYQPPMSDDIFAEFEDFLPSEANEKEIEPCYGYSPASRASKIHTVSPEINGVHENPMKKFANGITDMNGEIEEDGSGWETVSHDEEHGSSNSPGESDPSVNGFHEESNVSGSGTEWEDNANNGTPNTEISEVISARKLQKKASSISRLWKSCPNNGENYKTSSVEAANGRLSNGVESLDGGSCEGGVSPSILRQWSSPESGNPHITRGMKGCIEWPRGMQKHSLKAKLLEARLESQKIQLRHVLKQKI